MFIDIPIQERDEINGKQHWHYTHVDLADKCGVVDVGREDRAILITFPA
jgi:hypothetical protein